MPRFDFTFFHSSLLLAAFTGFTEEIGDKQCMLLSVSISLVYGYFNRHRLLVSFADIAWHGLVMSVFIRVLVACKKEDKT